MECPAQHRARSLLQHRLWRVGGCYSRIPECLGFEGTSGDPPAQRPAEAGSPTAGCTAPRPGGSGISPEKENPQPLRATCSSALSPSEWVGSQDVSCKQRKGPKRSTHRAFPQRLLLAGCEVWSVPVCADRRLLRGHFSSMAELSRGQSAELGAVSHRWSSQTFQPGATRNQGMVCTLSAVYLHTSALAWESLPEKNKTLFSYSLERSLPESCWAGPDKGT